MLPVASILTDLRTALRIHGSAVLHAPPGAGKTTLVPPALLDEPWLGTGRIVMLEPRRLAARAAARRMAFLRGEPVGRTIGYRTRLDTRVSAQTRVEVVTEGVLTRMLQHDPTLDGYGLVIFDEFHERSLQADAGLALALHSRSLVRPDLRVLVMSATIDAVAVADLLNQAPIITTPDVRFDVETRYRPVPATRVGRLNAGAIAAVIASVTGETAGDVLVFLPGAPEIHRVAECLGDLGKRDIDVMPLHGSLTPEEQDRALAPAASGRRKVVLATSIAETSITIDGVRVVVDCGLSRRSRFSPRTGMSRLETLRVSRAAADQRRGRAGRTAPGIGYRLWSTEEDATLLAFAPPEIIEADLAPLALDLAVAGVSDPAELNWLTPPRSSAFSQARELLTALRALDSEGRATAHGRAIAALGMHPRLAHMVLTASSQRTGAGACELAALLTERDPLRNMRDVVGTDVRVRFDALRRPRDFPGADAGVLLRAAEQSRRWNAQLTDNRETSSDAAATGRLLALAFPDRVAQRRPGPQPRFLMRNGSGAVLPEGDPLTQEPYIVVAESDGRSPEARIWLAAPLSPEDIEADFADQIVEHDIVEWDDREGVRAFRDRRLGAIVLARRMVKDPDPALVAAAVSHAIRQLGLAVLPWSERADRLRARLAFLHHHDRSWPDVSDAALAGSLLRQLHESLGVVRSARQFQALDVAGGLLALLDWQQRRLLDQLAPTHFEAPTGSRLPVDYTDPRAPAVSIRLQELFGVQETPTVFNGRVALTLHLLSPAHRPVQVTGDLAGFWRSSYYDVRKDLRARYPKHSWPVDPLTAPATKRTRKRDQSD